MFDGNLEARSRSIVRGINSPPGIPRTRTTSTLKAYSSFELVHRKPQLANPPVRLVPQNLLQQRPIVPKRSVAPAVEPRPHRFSNFPVVGKNRAHVIQFVRGRKQPGVRIGSLQMPDVSLFAFAPRRLGFRVR